MPRFQTSKDDVRRVAELMRLGAAHHRSGRLPAAEACYRQVVRLAPQHADALHLLGVINASLGHDEAAADLIAAAIRQNDDNPASFNNLGNVLTRLRRLDEAVACFERAIALRPDYAEAHTNLGVALRHLDRLDEALARLDRAVALKPGAAEAHCNRGLVLAAMNRLDEAVESFDRAIALRPGYAQAYSNRGNALVARRQLDEAVANYTQSLAAKPDHPEVLSNLGAALTLLGRLDQALECIDFAISLKPDLAGAHCNRGDVLSQLHRLQEAGASYDRAVALDPSSPDFARNKAHHCLLLGKYREGWPLFERRWEARGFTSPVRNFGKPQWRGEPIDGRRVLLHAEQGFGDSIQFCRYATLAAERCRVFLEVPKLLVRLLKSLSGVTEVFPAGDPLPDFDLHCPLLSLPLAFGTELHTIPAPIGYLRADPSIRSEYMLHAASAETPQIGLVWSGRASHGNDRNRSISLPALLPLLGCGAAFYSLQTEVRDADREWLEREHRVRPLGLSFRDFAETAAVISQLDLVISVDTSIAHLAAALGKPTWVLLPFAPDWRWLLDRDDSPWYPTARLFRQPARGDWQTVIEQVGRELRRCYVRNAAPVQV